MTEQIKHGVEASGFAGRQRTATPQALLSTSSLVLAIAALLAVLLVVGCGGGANAASDEPRLLTVAVAPAQEARDFEVVSEYQGQIEPRRRSRIGFDLAGVVTSVAVDEGATVGRGATIAQLDTQRLIVRKRQVEAAVAEAETARELAHSTLIRFEKAVERKAVSPQDLDEARRRLDGAEAALRRTQAELDSVEVDLAKSTLRAPYRGVVTQRLIDEGEAVAPGQGIIEVIEIDGPRVRVGVPLAVATEATLRKEVTFLVGQERVAGNLLANLPEQSGQTRTVDLLFELDQPLDTLRVGQVARLEISRPAAASGIALPSRALTESSRGLWSCLVAVPSNAADATEESVTGDAYQLEERVVEIVEVSSHDEEPLVMVRGALQVGELVVMEGLHRLIPGQMVTIQTMQPTQASAPELGRHEGTVPDLGEAVSQ